MVRTVASSSSHIEGTNKQANGCRFWSILRASYTFIGLLKPTFEEGEFCLCFMEVLVRGAGRGLPVQTNYIKLQIRYRDEMVINFHW